MEQFIMKGGNPLVGEVTIGGAKNAALGILAASIMTDEDVVIENLPDVRGYIKDWSSCGAHRPPYGEDQREAYQRGERG